MSWSRNEEEKGVHCVGLVVRKVGGVWENLVEGGNQKGVAVIFSSSFSVFCFGGSYDRK